MASSTGIVSFPLGLSVCKDYKFFSAKKVGWCLFFFLKNPKPNQNTNPNNGGGSGKQNMHALCCTQEPWLRRAALREDPVGNTTL